jgi:hypothetical protein
MFCHCQKQDSTMAFVPENVGIFCPTPRVLYV